MDKINPYKVIDVTEWRKIGYSKGTKEKCNVIDPITQKIYMLKYPAKYDVSINDDISDNPINGDTWAERIASEVGKVLGIKVQTTELAVSDLGDGILLEYSLDKNEEKLEEGVIYLSAYLKTKNIEFDAKKPENYTFENIKICIEKEEVMLDDFINILFFDAVIGNTDRHSENWGIITNYRTRKKRIIAAYDNGSSLGRDYHSKEEKIAELNMEKYLENARSCIRISDNERISHYKFLEEILKQYPHKRVEYLSKINCLTEIEINTIIDRVPAKFMSTLLKEFVKNILLNRKKRIIEILGEDKK